MGIGGVSTNHKQLVSQWRDVPLLPNGPLTLLGTAGLEQEQSQSAADERHGSQPPD